MKDYEKLSKGRGFYLTSKNRVVNFNEGIKQIKEFLKDSEPKMVATFDEFLTGAIHALDDGYTQVHIGGIEYHFDVSIIRLGNETKIII